MASDLTSTDTSDSKSVSPSGTQAPKKGSALSRNAAIDHIIQCYGDLLFDLCESVLWSPINAQLAFRAILKTLRKQNPDASFRDHERAWVLQVAFTTLLDLSPRHGRRLTSSEQIQLDAAQNVSLRLGQFDAYFHRLMIEDQILLLLRDKYGLPYPEIASAMGLPEDTLKIRRSHALRTLEEWLWDNR